MYLYPHYKRPRLENNFINMKDLNYSNLIYFQGLDPPQLRSDTPESIFVTWRAPRVSNGILDNYRLERKINASDNENERYRLTD